MGFGPTTFGLGSRHSTTELPSQILVFPSRQSFTQIPLIMNYIRGGLCKIYSPKLIWIRRERDANIQAFECPPLPRQGHTFIPLKTRCNSGERGIRTPGTSQFNGFQDRHNRPLCHLSRHVCHHDCHILNPKPLC